MGRCEMILLSSIIKKFESRFFDKYKNSILPSHKKALWNMQRCRTKYYSPHMLVLCTNYRCLNQIYLPHSCGHRNCPHCQNHESTNGLKNN